MKFGTRLILTGKTRHGKNRVREQGAIWEVSTPLGVFSNPHTQGKTELRSVLTGDRRWVSLSNDPDFFFEEENAS
jgi:hypothetical protein